MLVDSGPPYLRRIRVISERVEDFSVYPFSVPVVTNLDLTFKRPLTFIVGENGCGKSTIMEAIAGLLGMPTTGGGRNEAVGSFGRGAEHEALTGALRPSFCRRPRDMYFFRGEFAAHFARTLETRKRDPDFAGDPYAAYGGKSLVDQSHGESFLPH